MRHGNRLSYFRVNCAAMGVNAKCEGKGHPGRLNHIHKGQELEEHEDLASLSCVGEGATGVLRLRQAEPDGKGLAASSPAQLLSLFETPWAVAHQAPLSREFSRQEYWSGLPCPTLGDLPDPGIKLTFPILGGRFFTTKPARNPASKLRTLYP